jgi:27-O-demethylrifamycin SV methyltransferase
VQLAPDLEFLDVGCGTGAPACALAAEFGVKVTGLTTSQVGVDEARARARRLGLADRTRFEVRDGTENEFPDCSFDRAWALESSHLMPRRDRLVSECARVLRPGGIFALCDIVLRREMPLSEVIRLREPLTLLRQVFGDAHMKLLDTYAAFARDAGLEVVEQIDLTAATRPTFARWRENAELHYDEVAALLGEVDTQRFVDSCDVLQGFWDDGTLGYGLISARRSA